jgi:hypothetical protein
MRATLLVCAVVLAGCGGDAPTAPAGRFEQGPLAVSAAEVTVAESLPLQVNLHVVGGGAPCTIVGPVTQQRRGNVIEVRLETYWTAEYCILSFVEIRYTTPLQGPFEPGDYVVRANGVETRFKI